MPKGGRRTTGSPGSVVDEITGPLPVHARLGAAVVTVEDEHCYSNVFLNVFDGAARAALASLHAGGDPGGSTIAQQLAKQLYATPNDFGATLGQIGLGVKLALSYSKAEILNMYLNAVYYGNGFWGDVFAARGYFGVNPGELTWAEAPLLAVFPRRPRPTTLSSTSRSPNCASATCSSNWSPTII